MKRICILLMLFCLVNASIAQNSSQNYVRSRTMQNETGTSYMDQVVYYDGLGRPFQTVHMGVTPLNQNLVNLQEYDDSGREIKSWLSVQTTSNYLSPTSFPSSAATSYTQESRPFSQSVYEPSSFDRVTTQQGPGQEWNGKVIATEYLLNSTSSPLNCIRYSVSGSTLTANGNYGAGQLYVTKTKDEDGHLNYQFTDKQNRVVLTRQQDGSTTHDTYYVYNDYGNLYFVLQPMYQILPNLALYAFQYKYDDRNLCIEKSFPGGNLITYVYDNTDRLIFSQDGKQRTLNKWTFYLYDNLNRLTMQGECSNTNTASASRAVITCTLSKNSAGVIASGWGNSGYSSTFSLASPTIHTVHYYDDYSFRALTGFNNSNFVNGSYAKGFPTGSVTAILDKGTLLYAANYYDIKSRVTKTVQSNLLGGYETTNVTYTFTGKPLSIQHIHTAIGKATQTEVYGYTYDRAERVTAIEHTLNGAKVTLATTAYDFLGRPESRTPHGIAANKLTYRYNIRNWLAEISGTPFTQTLFYTDGTGTACYNGNISSMIWRAGDESAMRGYKYTYDGLNRLSSAAYGEGSALTTNAGRFNESASSYDRNGNILSLQRWGKTEVSAYNVVDNLTFTYDGNRLRKVSDAITASPYGTGTNFVNGAPTTAPEYTYDSSGNLTADLNKKISNIQYNSLNLPTSVTFSSGSSVSNEYGSDGVKYRAKHTSGGTTITTDYCQNMIYENGVISKILTGEGYVTLSGATPTYHYFVQDHQGNNRMVLSQSGTAEEVNHYYPFGGLFGEGAAMVNQSYKYNGKELDRKYGLGWYDYRARMYDAELGRWHVMDPLSELSFSSSTYGYCKNNPINRIDLGGKWDVTVHAHSNRENFGYGFLTVMDKSGNEVYRTTVRLEGSNSKENSYNKRDRTRTYGDTPAGQYSIRGWSTRLSNKNRGAYGFNAVLELDYTSGEAAGLRNGMHLHGGRQEGKGGKGKGSMLEVTQGCLRIYDEDIAEMKRITDFLEENDSEEKGNTLNVVNDLNRINDGPHPRPFDYPKQVSKQNNDPWDILYRFLSENPGIKFIID